jgi:hypothetical protein
MLKVQKQNKITRVKKFRLKLSRLSHKLILSHLSKPK